MILLGITGLAGSGKNYVADQIMAKYENSKQLAFADPLKHMVHHMFGIPLEDCYTEAGKNRETWHKWGDIVTWTYDVTEESKRRDPAKPMTVRDLLQVVGTELVRNQWNEDHWVRLMKHRIENCPHEVVLVTDVRFPNEAQLIKEMGGTLLKVTGRQASGVPSHVSEADVIQADSLIVNTPGTTPGMIVDQVERAVPGFTSTSPVPLCALRQP